MSTLPGAAATKVKFFTGGLTSGQQARVVAPWVMAEVLATDDRQSLEGLGLIRLSLYRDPTWEPPKPLLTLGMTEDEAWAFVEELVRVLRQQGAVTMPESVPSNHDIFVPRLGPIRARLSGSEAVRKVLSWIPTRGTNRRIDYVRRVLAALDSAADPTDVLTGVWNWLVSDNTPVDWLRSSTEQGLGVVHQLDHERLRLSWVTDADPVFQCSRCRRTAPGSVRGVCPALNCEGELQPFTPPPAGVDRDHYRAVYRGMNAVPLSAMEHTAQWDNREAASIQQRFIRGEHQHALLLDHLRAWSRCRGAAGGDAAQHAAQHGQLPSTRRPGGSAGGRCRAGRHLCDAAVPRPDALRRARSDDHRRGAGAVRAARQRPHRPAPPPLGGPGGVLPVALREHRPYRSQGG